MVWKSRVGEQLRDYLSSLDGKRREELVSEVFSMIEEAVQEERVRCASLCRAREELWRTTSGASPAAPELSREEARARANEAVYLADLIEMDPNDTGKEPN